MALQPINNSDNNTDNIQSAGTKINNNFTDLYANKLDPNIGFNYIGLPTTNNDFLKWTSVGDSWYPRIQDDVVLAVTAPGDYTQALSSGLTQLSALNPVVDDVVGYGSNAWETQTLSQLRARTSTVTNCIEMFDDFTYAVRVNFNITQSTYRWIGQAHEVSTIYTPYGAFGIGETLVSPSLYVFFIDVSQDNVIASGVNAPGVIWTTPNIFTKFRMARTASARAGTGFYGGYFSAPAVTSAYGAYFLVTDSGNIMCVTKDSLGTTTTDSGLGMTYSAWYTFSITTNDDGTQVSFYINDVLKATHTANISTSTTRFGIAKNATWVGGTSAVGNMGLDYWYLYIPGLNRI